MSFTELLKQEVWEKKLQASGYRVIHEPCSTEPEKKDSEEKVDAANLKPNLWTIGKPRHP